jgi:hypothetical protein
VAGICGKEPSELHESDRLANLCPPTKPKWLDSVEREDLMDFIYAETTSDPRKGITWETIGEVMDFVLADKPPDRPIKRAATWRAWLRALFGGRIT